MFSMWLVGTLLSLPVGLGMISSRVFNARYFCAVDGGSPLLFAGLLLSFYVVCLLTLLLCFLVILYRAHQARVGTRTSLPQQLQMGRTALHVHEYRQFTDNLNLGKFCVLLFVVYFILHGLYLFLSIAIQFVTLVAPLEYSG